MPVDRRQFLNACGKLGFASTLLPGALYAVAVKAAATRITAAMIDEAGLVAGIPIDRKSVV